MKRAEFVVVLAIAATGAVLLVVHRDLPLLRNALVYAQMVGHLLDTGFDVSAVTNEFPRSYGRPIGFPLLAAPLATLVGASDALRLAGYLGTLPFLVACWAFFRRYNPRFGVPESWIPAQLLLCFANPLSMYQFWAAYPDTLFAAIVLVFVMLVDDLLERPEHASAGRIAATTLVALAGMVLKHYGLILVPMAAFFLVLRWRAARTLLTLPATKAASWIAGASVGGMLLLARFGLNPLLNLDSRAGGFEGFVEGVREVSFPLFNNLAIFAAFLVLCLHVALPLLVRRPRPSRASWAPVLVFGVYVFGLLTYYMAWFNVRFFLPVLPMVVLLLARAYRESSAGVAVRRVGVAIFSMVALLLIANYNSRTVHLALAPVNEFVDEHRRLRNLVDSLRMGVHLEVERSLLRLNEAAEPGARVFYVTWYNTDASHGVYRADGLLRADLVIEYVEKLEEVQSRVAPGEHFYVFIPREQLPSPSPPRPELGKRLGLERRGHGVFEGRLPVSS